MLCRVLRHAFGTRRKPVLASARLQATVCSCTPDLNLCCRLILLMQMQMQHGLGDVSVVVTTWHRSDIRRAGGRGHPFVLCYAMLGMSFVPHPSFLETIIMSVHMAFAVSTRHLPCLRGRLFGGVWCRFQDSRMFIVTASSRLASRAVTTAASITTAVRERVSTAMVML